MDTIKQNCLIFGFKFLAETVVNEFPIGGIFLANGKIA
jgi:hypothetical protein